MRRSSRAASSISSTASGSWCRDVDSLIAAGTVVSSCAAECGRPSLSSRSRVTSRFTFGAIRFAAAAVPTTALIGPPSPQGGMPGRLPAGAGYPARVRPRSGSARRSVPCSRTPGPPPSAADIGTAPSIGAARNLNSGARRAGIDVETNRLRIALIGGVDLSPCSRAANDLHFRL